MSQIDDDQDEYWREQAQRPLFRRSWTWWSEVALSNVIGAVLVVLLSLAAAAALVLTVYEWLR